MGKFIEIVLPGVSGVRTRSEDGCPDMADCLEWDRAMAAVMRQPENLEALWDGRLVVQDPAAVAAASPVQTFASRMGSPSYVQRQNGNGSSSSCKPSMLEDGGTPTGAGCPEEDRECGITPLTFNSYGIAGYPFPGTVVNALVQAPNPIIVQAGRTTWYRPKWLFFSCRDAAAAMAQMEGHLTRAEVAGNSQLANVNTTQMAIGSDMFLAQQGPLRIDDWRAFGNTAPNLLSLFFGNAQGIATSLTVSGCFWGDPNYAPPGVSS